MSVLASLVISSVLWTGDTFTFKANDGELDSNEALVIVLKAGSGELQATDVDGDALTYSVVTPPTSGFVTITGSAFTYKPRDIKITKTGEGFWTLQRSFNLTDWTDLIVFLTPDGVYYDARFSEKQFYRLWIPL